VDRRICADHRFDQDAMLAAVEKLIQSSAAAGYALTRLVGHLGPMSMAPFLDPTSLFNHL
jgi:hypothetical protein